MNYEFSFVKDVERTWDNAVKMLEVAVGGNYNLTRRNEEKVRFRPAISVMCSGAQRCIPKACPFFQDSTA